MEFTQIAPDRRTKKRFKLQREIRYKMVEDGVVVAAGIGQTLDVGSGGVAFAADGAMQEGAFVELSISWPALLDERCPMRLIVFGQILRAHGRKAVCSVNKYEFRTQSRTLRTMPIPRTDARLQRWSDGVRKEALKSRMAGA
jgi:hypothetical protein